MADTTYSPVLKALAIAGSLANAGTMTSGFRLLPSVYPSVQASPANAAKQWEYFYWSMSATVPWIDLATFIAIGRLAYESYSQNSTGSTWKIWASAAGLMPIGWVWVRKVMLVPSNKLLAISGSAAANGDAKGPVVTSQSTLELLKEFNSEMGVRMLFPWVVGGLALWATLRT